ncbi:uncharacterized protein LOC118256732 isoform X3 [Cygnus atratus]|uniref:uncharacterized protein LOC118256732 isoform X3 n=1 Tax=Cygnus atratus TaxID=8868 RepID=UPI0015D63FF8|nr:uncharacterized protein LOC118256732 isoform X3 [Cygnus atratus]
MYLKRAAVGRPGHGHGLSWKLERDTRVPEDFHRLMGLVVSLGLYVNYYPSSKCGGEVMEQGLGELDPGSSLCKHVSEKSSSRQARSWAWTKLETGKRHEVAGFFRWVGVYGLMRTGLYLETHTFSRLMGLVVSLGLYVNYYPSSKCGGEVMEQGLGELDPGSSLCKHVSEKSSSRQARSWAWTKLETGKRHEVAGFFRWVGVYGLMRTGLYLETHTFSRSLRIFTD